MPAPVSEQKNNPILLQLNTEILQSLLHSLEIVVDPRKERGKRYPIITILTIAICGCICIGDNVEALEAFG